MNHCGLAPSEIGAASIYHRISSTATFRSIDARAIVCGAALDFVAGKLYQRQIGVDFS
jgi:hypothetical protein